MGNSTQRIGAGRPLIVLHGGPGLDYRYLIGPLRFLADERELIFFDQLACGDDSGRVEDATLEATVAHAESTVVELIGHQDFGVIAHSWGALLALQLAMPQSNVASRVSDMYLICPYPLRWDWAKECSVAFRSQFSPDQLQAAEELYRNPDRAAGKLYMQDILPHYLSDDRFVRDVNIYSYNPQVLGNVLRSMGDFEITVEDLQLPSHLCVIRGQFDFVHRRWTQPLDDVAHHRADLACKHFPFIEVPADFRRCMLEVLSD